MNLIRAIAIIAILLGMIGFSASLAHKLSQMDKKLDAIKAVAEKYEQ